MVTPHLPPDQAANALLPKLLHDNLVKRGHEIRLMAFAPHSERPRSEGTYYVHRPRSGWLGIRRISQAITMLSVLQKARQAFEDIDVVHIHSNTFMNQVVAAVAYFRRIPFVLTHYGTEIWHYKRRLIDPFLWMNKKAAHVTYYSHLLRDRSIELGVVSRKHSVVYPPVGEQFQLPTKEERAKAKRELGIDGPMILNVKRLHPLAGQRYAIEAMPFLLGSFPNAKLVVAGEGESRGELELLISDLGLTNSVTLLGLVDNKKLPRYYHAADLFVLPSRLEAFPTVAVEALASGVPVVTADHPGGVELSQLFPEDVRVVPREQIEPLAKVLRTELDRNKRCSNLTMKRIEKEFRPDGAVNSFLKLYQDAQD